MLLAQAALALQAPRAAALHLQPAPVAGTHAGCSRCPPVRAAYALDEDTSHLDDSCSSALTSGMDPKQLLSPDEQAESAPPARAPTRHLRPAQARRIRWA